MRNHRLLLAAASLGLVSSVCLIGCLEMTPRVAAPAAVATTPSPATVAGSASVAVFDQRAFATLVTVQNALEAISAQIEHFPQYKPQLNKAIDLYNRAEVVYKTFHQAGARGSPADVEAALAALTGAVAEVATLIHPGGN